MEIWLTIWTFLNSAFFMAALTGLGGAYFGARAAQEITEREKRREELIKEIRHTNAAINVAGRICSSLISLKKQHVKSLKDKFDEAKTAILAVRAQVAAGNPPVGGVYSFVADLQTFSLQRLPIGILQNQVFEKISAVGRPLTLATVLAETLFSLSQSMERRNALIEQYKATPVAISPELYFGLPLAGGHINEDYPATIKHISAQTDDGIFFSKLLAEDLTKYGEELATQFRRKFRVASPVVTRWDFTPEAAMFPDEAAYGDWMTNFKKMEATIDPLLVRLCPTFADVYSGLLGWAKGKASAENKQQLKRPGSNYC